MKKTFLLGLAFCLSVTLLAQEKTDALLVDILKKQPEKFGAILANPSVHRVQIVYTQIDRDAQNRPRFRTYRYRVNPQEYFYPASTVKFPACLLALEKANQLAKTHAEYLNAEDFKHRTAMLTAAAPTLNFGEQVDTSNHEMPVGLPSLAHHVKKILLVSDNESFNRLYEFLGQNAFNQRLHDKGYRNVRMLHRLSRALSRDQNATTNPIDFVQLKPGQNGKAVTRDTLFHQPSFYNPLAYAPKTAIKMGKGYMVGRNYYVGDSLVNEPFDFTYRNYFALEDQQAILRAVMFPEAVKPSQRFNLTPEDYRFLYTYMSMSPLESTSPQYPNQDSVGGWDAYCKFLMYGDSKQPMPKSVRIFNKVGDAYGFLIDNAYIVDFDKKVEFLLSAVIYCNADGVFNDDKYDYDAVGFPFLANLGKAIYEYELKRPRSVKPNLEKFKMNYAR